MNMNFLSSTPARIALATVGTAAVAAGSYLIGHHNGAKKACEVIEGMLPDIIMDAIAKKEALQKENAN